MGPRASLQPATEGHAQAQREKYSFVSHVGLSILNPIPASKLDDVLALLPVDARARILDVGCGKGELLIRAIARYGCAGVGLDRSHAFLADAQAAAAARVPGARLELHAVDATAFVVDPETYDVACCVGSTSIFGGARATVRALARIARPGGFVVLGEGYWRKEPDPAYLASFGGRRDELVSHEDNVAMGVAEGLVPHYASVASEDDWDRYEWLHCRAVERYAEESPWDPDVPALLARVRGWRDAWLRWGRETMGFGLYLFAKPGPRAPA